MAFEDGVGRGDMSEAFIETSKTLLIFDLDETLIHSSREIRGPVHFRLSDFYVHLRPGFEDLLERVKGSYEIAVWSAASGNYVSAIVEKIFPDFARPRFVWSGLKCTWRFDAETRERYGVKRLKKLKRFGYSLDRMLIVEDDPRKCEDNFGNALYVPCFYGDSEDRVLYKLAEYLLSIEEVASVRSLEKRGWLSS